MDVVAVAVATVVATKEIINTENYLAFKHTRQTLPAECGTAGADSLTLTGSLRC